MEKCKQALKVTEHQEFDAELDNISFLLHMYSVMLLCTTVVTFFVQDIPLSYLNKETNSLSGNNQTQQHILFLSLP